MTVETQVAKLASPEPLRTTARVLEHDGWSELADRYQTRVDEIDNHNRILTEIADRRLIGSALGEIEHGRLTAQFLIEQGWTPPVGLVIVEVVSDDDA